MNKGHTAKESTRGCWDVARMRVDKRRARSGRLLLPSTAWPSTRRPQPLTH